jgi:hypothetical protein
MTRRNLILLAAFAVLFLTLACVTIMGGDLPEVILTEPEEEYHFEEPPTEEPALQTGLSCPLITDEIIQLAVFYDENFEEDLLDEEVTIIIYTVEGDDLFDPRHENVTADLKEAQDDAYTHQRVWEHFVALIPADQRRIIVEYAITTDGLGGTLAAVAQTDFDPALWVLYVDIADTSNDFELTYTLIHEFGHILTLGPDQVTPSLAIFNNPDDEDIYFQEASACLNYFPGEGCASPDSYIHNFFHAFWEDIHEEWNEINLEEDDDIYYEKLDEFYYKYEDKFLTSYAATNPEEDIAEAFTFFIISPKPAGDSIAEQKILFFYQYPELVELRETILNNVCMYFPN